MRPDRALLAFAAAVFVFHQAPAFVGPAIGPAAGDAVEALTPFAVVAATAAVLGGLHAGRAAVIAALVAGTLYVHGVGIHLAANSIHNELGGEPGGIVYFWDERFSHVETVLGWFGLVAAFCLAEARAGDRGERSTAVLLAAAIVLGWTFFTSTVEGQTWPLELAATALFGAWAVRSGRGRPLLRASAAAFAVGALLIGVWAVLNGGGLPEFSDSGII